MDLGRRHGPLIKTAREIELMRNAGLLVRSVLRQLQLEAVAGVTTAFLNERAEKLIAEGGGIPLFKGVTNPQAACPFPAAICTSLNEELVHGIPSDRVIREGDLLTIDCGVRIDGYCCDAAVTIGVGRIAPESQRLLKVAREVLSLAIGLIRPDGMWSDVARAMQAFVEDKGFSVIRDFVGHGIGRDMHELPKVPNYWDGDFRNVDFRLVPNLAIAIEPMVSAGTHEVDLIGSDRWVFVTRDRSRCVHVEHTVCVTETGAEVLTL